MQSELTDTWCDAETAIGRLEAKNMLTNYKINAMGPMLVAKVRQYGSPCLACILILIG